MMKGRFLAKPALAACAAMLAGCASPDFLATPRERAERVAARHGWQRATYPAGPFILAAYQRFGARQDGELAVYIESDGRAWLDRSTLSPDPTPVHPLVLNLAVQDPALHRLYLARPCQYLADAERARCSPVYWSDGRFAPEVVAATDAAISAAKRESGAARVRLVGYSGGGAVAALVAARRDDVSLLITIAGTLDHARWTRDAGVSPLSRSLNPADEAARLAAVPQIHFVGDRDRIVPPAVADSFVARLPDRSRVRVVRMSDHTHECCWTDAWPDLLARHLAQRPQQ